MLMRYLVSAGHQLVLLVLWRTHLFVDCGGEPPKARRRAWSSRLAASQQTRSADLHSMPRRNAADVVAAAAAAEGLSPAAAAAFAGLPDLTLRPCRASALPPELERATAALVRDNMDEVFAASGWDEADAEEGCAVGEPLYLLLLDARDALLGFVQCEFSLLYFPLSI